MIKPRDHRTLAALVIVAISVTGCSRGMRTRSSAASSTASDPCEKKLAGDFCVPELPVAAPVVAGEGRIWVLFGQRGKFEIREYSPKGDGVLAQGTCPGKTFAAALGSVDGQPAVVCAEFEQSTVVFGRKLPNSQNFAWQSPERLSHDTDESVQAISHFALLDRRLSIVYRTESKGLTSGLPTTQWRLQIAANAAQVTRATQSSASSVPPQSEILCPRPGVSRCDKPPIAAYVADGQMHVVLASGISADRYLHLQQAPGKSPKILPVADVTMMGKAPKEPCVSKSTAGNLKVYVPARTLVSSLMTDQGERVGVIEHGVAAIAQGPDVYSSDETRCPPEVNTLAALPNGAAGSQDVKPQWLRATQSNDTWLVGYGLPSFAVKQGESMVSYKESFWVVRR
jgi:hypothetical protein